MAGISSKALSFGDPKNKKKYNGIEFDEDFDIDTYEAFYRNLDPQLGRWWQIDPQIDSDMENVPPYASMYDNPLNYSDFKGNTPESPNPPDKNQNSATSILKKTVKMAGVVIVAGGGPEDVPADGVAVVTFAAGTITAGVVWIYHQFAQHKKDARSSTEQKHQEGRTRKQQDRQGSKGQKNPPRKKPPNWNGAWPPKKFII